jgi:NAD(P)-dependent dehydrogenase (short-subunit alcohol dehydrogenase family)
MSEQTLALVTGAHQGIGYEMAAGLGALGWSVGVGDRDPERQPKLRCMAQCCLAYASLLPLNSLLSQ